MRQRFLSNRIAPYLVLIAAISLGGFLFSYPSAHALSPVVHYTFDGTSNDWSGNGNDLNFADSPSYITGELGEAVLPAPPNVFAQSSNDPFDGDGTPNGFTICQWLNRTSSVPMADGEEFIVITGGGWSGTNLGLMLDDNNKFSVQYSGYPEHATTWSFPIDGQWHLVCWTHAHDGDNTVYLDDNSSTVSDVGNVNGGIDPPAGNLYLFAYESSGGTNQYDGSMDDFQVFNSVLSQSDIDQIYNNTSSLSYENVQQYYHASSSPIL